MDMSASIERQTVCKAVGELFHGQGMNVSEEQIKNRFNLLVDLVRNGGSHGV